MSKTFTVCEYTIEGNTVVEVPVEEVGIGDAVIVRGGGVVPVDGVLLSAEAVLDESALTGESLPAVYSRGATLRSGTSNAAAAIK